MKEHRKNMMLFFNSLEEDYSMYPVRRPNMTEEMINFLKNKVPQNQCHNFVFKYQKIIMDCYPEIKVDLVLGYINVYKDELFQKVTLHSFLKIKFEDCVSIYDPYLLKFAPEGYSFRNHKGIPLPRVWVEEITKTYNDVNYAGYLKQYVFKSRQLTDELIQLLKSLSKNV